MEECANPPTALTGGPKDTIPPTLISSYPENGKINFKEKEFILEFDEPINADKLSQEILITPTNDNRFSHLVKKHRLTIKFDEAFDDSTTYTLNFRKGVGDATEKNSVVNLKIAFSTGSYIDSLYIQGYVEDYITQSPSKSYLVGLYQTSDTLRYDQVKPMYFTNTLDDGQFIIENIKEGNYVTFAFKDENNNLLFDPADESFAVSPDTLYLNSEYQKDSIIFHSIQVNATPLNFISSRPSGKNFVVRYNREVKEFTISQLSENNDIKYAPNEDNSEMIFYPGRDIIDPNDSTGFIIKARDTLNNQTIDTTFVKFIESSRKPKELKTTIITATLTKDTLTCVLDFNKPIIEFNLKEIYVTIDTIYKEPIYNNTTVTYNQFNTSVTLKTYFDEQKIIDSINSKLSDTLQFINSLPLTKIEFNNRSILSVEFDTLKNLTPIGITKTKTESTGVINLLINTDFKSFEVRLLNNKGSVVRSFKNKKTVTLNNLTPDKYQIFILIDENNNGRWEIANPYTNTVSEPIYIYPEITELRANWIVDIDDISF